MGKQKASTKGTPAPWVELLRRHWASIHTIECHWRLSNRAAWVTVPDSQRVIPEIVGDEEGDEEATREGPEGAADVAGDLFALCWDHLAESDRERLFFSITAYGLGADGASLQKLETCATGGSLRSDGVIEIPAWDEEGDEERTRTREDFLFKQNKELHRMMLRIFGGVAGFMESFTGIASETMKSRAEIASKDLEFREAELDAEVARERTEQAGNAVREAVQSMSPGFNMWAAARHAEATRPAGANDAPAHDDPIVQSARVLLSTLDGPMMSYLLPILGAELAGDVLTVLRPALDDAADPVALAHAWQSIAPALLKHQSRVAKDLPPDLAQRLATSLQAFHLAAQSAAA